MQNTRQVTNSGERISLDYGQKNEHIFLECRNVDSHVPIHWHSYFELEIITDGEAEHYLNDEKYTVSRGSAYILNPTDFHEMLPRGELSLWNVCFDEEMISERRLFELSASDKKRIFTLDESQLSKICALTEILRSESEERGGGCSRELCESLLTLIMRNGENTEQTEIGSLDGIRRAMVYLGVHFRESPSLEKIAEQAGFHPTYFSELFKKVTGESYSDRLNTLRTGYAKGLLARGFSVTEACYQSGFGSLSNFLRVFKKSTGISPEEYRKKYR